MAIQRVNWLKIVQFHKDIIQSAHKEAFQLPIEAISKRWTSLDNFQPGDTAGPWTIDLQNVRQHGFFESLKGMNSPTCFIGGPGYLGSTKKRGPWENFWTPLLFKEVSVEQQSEELLIKPIAAYWHICPGVLEWMTSKEVSVETSPSKIVEEILEEAQNSTTDKALSDRLLVAFLARVPALKEKLQLDRRFKELPSANQPTPWFLFQSTHGVETFDINLMRDYEILEAALKMNPEEIGGLAILEGATQFKQGDLVTPIEVLPLNPQQQKAVATVLANNPLTVISGPPGCGKSQVVTSLLMNCWGQGISSLFASTNNEAVDVVRERIKKFEGEYPVAVRAGNYEKNNIKEVLNFAIARGATERQGAVGKSKSEGVNSRVALAQRKERIVQQLESEVPQRIAELIQTALQSYADHLLRSEAIRQKGEALKLELRTLVGADRSITDINDGVFVTKKWLALLFTFQEKSSQAQSIKAEAIQSLSEYESKCEKLYKNFSITWKSTDMRPAWTQYSEINRKLDSWKNLFVAATQFDMEKAWTPKLWQEGFNQWETADEATRVSKEAHDAAISIHAWVKSCLVTWKQLEQSEANYKKLDKAASKAGVPKVLADQSSILSKWKRALIKSKDTKGGVLDWIGVGTKSSAARLFKEINQELLAILPSDWSGDLHQIIDTAIAWSKAKSDFFQLKESLEVQASELHERATSLLQAGKTPVPQVIADWQKLINQLQLRTKEAKLASDAHEFRKNADDSLEKVRSIVNQFFSVIGVSPIASRWIAGEGRVVSETLRRIADRPTVSEVVLIKNAIQGDCFTSFLQETQSIHAVHEELATIEKKLAACKPVEHFVDSWKAKKPGAGLPPLEAPESGWPSPDWLANAESIIERTHKCAIKKQQFDDVEKPASILESEEGLRWAKSKLNEAADQLMSKAEQEHAKKEIANAIAVQDAWVSQSIQNVFRGQDPEILRAEIAKLDRQLETTSFADAQDQWLERLRTMDDSYEALDELSRRGSRKSWKLEESDGDLFGLVLKLVPIWIATAQSSQAIPVVPGLFDIVVIDEASQCTLTNILPLLFRAKRLVIIGDPKQLQGISSIAMPQEKVIASKYDLVEELDRWGHCLSDREPNDMFTVAVRSLPNRMVGVVNLLEHFRSHPQIIGFANHFIYGDRLVLRRESREIKMDHFGAGIHMQSVRGEATKSESGKKTWINQPEADAVIQLVKEIISKCPRSTLGIVTPFKGQAELLKSKLSTIDTHGNEVLVGTAHKLQGDERDIIIFSPVIAPGMPPMSVAFAESPPNLVNVALTRARDALFIVADLDFCAQQKGIFKDLAEYCRKVQLLRDTSLAELELYSWMVMEGWKPGIHVRVKEGHEVDFLLHAEDGRRIAVEVDGAEHHRDTTAQDRGIDAAIEASGCTVVRVKAKEALDTPQTVIDKIRKAMKSEI